MRRSQAIGSISAVVLLGAVLYVGFLIGEWNSQGRAAPDLQITRSALLEALDPTPEQRAELEAVMERTRLQADSVMRVLLGEIRVLTREAEAQMREHLTAEQQEILDTLLVGSRVRDQPQRRRRP